MLSILPALAAVLTLVTPISCSPTPLQDSSSAYALKSFHHPPRKWARVGTAPPDHIISLQIGLRQDRFDEVLRHLDEVSDPKHPRYGQHLSSAEVDDLVRPNEKTSSLVKAWLNEHEIDLSALNFSPAGDWVKIDLPIHKANRLLGCKYSVYKHQNDGTRLIRTPEWSLPRYLHDHVDVIEPTNSFMRPMKRSPRSTVKYDSYVAGEHVSFSHVAASSQAPNDTSVPAVCNTNLVTPDCLRTLYGTINYTVKAADKNKMAIANYLDEVNLRSDLSIYLQRYRAEAISAASSFQQISIDGGTLQQTPLNSSQIAAGTGIEGNLDVQTMIGIAYPTNMTSYSTGGRQPGFKPDNFTTDNTNEPYLAWVTYMLSLSDADLPYVVSTSYADDEQTVSKEYAVKVCNSFAQLGVKGVSLLFGSGDEGVGADGDCISNSPPHARTFLPEFPTSCPYITAIGGTYQFGPEVAAYDGRFKNPFTSGGGFSYYFPQPDYQKDAVSKYLAANGGFSQYTGLFNASGRAYPDFAAQSVNFSTIWNGQLRPVDGTSAATPAAAGIITLVNDALLASGKNTLGFLNPWLYQGGYKAFTDVLSGSAAGCETTGFTASPGWDAVTGFGTPNFPKILDSLGVTSGNEAQPGNGDDNDEDDDEEDDDEEDSLRRKAHKALKKGTKSPA